MFKINALKIEVNTEDGLYGADFVFSDGLNIIKGNNSSGKSTCLQAILYGLGMEELLGAKGEKTMQYVLREKVKSIDEQNVFKVIGCNIYLEISNYKDCITIKRSVLNQNKDSRLVDVYNGEYLTDKSKTYQFKSMYVHDPGAAQNNTYGFHAYLEEFIGWDLPFTTTGKGKKQKLYMQSIFPAFIIEQKNGWSDFLSTTPYYGIRNSENRAIEFLLALDVLENDVRKQELNEKYQDLSIRWQNLFTHLKEIAKSGAGILKGMNDKPEIINSLDSVYISIIQEEKEYILSEFIEKLSDELKFLENQNISTTGQSLTKNTQKLAELSDKITDFNMKFESLHEDQALEVEKLKEFKEQLNDVEDELRKNQNEKKLKDFGSEFNFGIVHGNCPTCLQSIKDTLLPQDIEKTPMLIEENIKYLKSQKEMLSVYISNQSNLIDKNNRLLEHIKIQINIIRQQIRELKKELVSDDRLPSEYEIEQKLILKNRVEFYYRLSNRFDSQMEILEHLIDEYESYKKAEAKLPSDYFSPFDYKKLSELTTFFKEHLRKFGYRSQEIDFLKISEDKYMPSVSGLLTLKKDYDIKYDSSASDFVRAIWAYTCSLYNVSVKFNGNHPALIIMDEPEQHSMADSSMKTLLEELSNYQPNFQSIIGASFHNKEEVYNNSVENIQNFKIHRIEGKLITKITK